MKKRKEIDRRRQNRVSEEKQEERKEVRQERKRRIGDKKIIKK